MSYILEKLGLKQQSCPCLIASKSDAIKFEIHLSCRNLAEEIFGTFHSLTKCEASFDIASAMPLFFSEIWNGDLPWGDCGLAVALHWKQLSFETWIFGWRLFDCFLLDMSFHPLVPWWRFSKKINIFQSILKQQNVTKHGKLEILKFSSNIQQEQRSNIWRKQPRLLSSKIRGSLDGARRNRWTEPHQPGKKSLITFHCTDCLTGIRDPYNGLAWFSKLPTQLGFSMST